MTQTLEEILTQFHDLNRRNLFDKLKMCQLVYAAKTQHGMEYKEFAAKTGAASSTVREYGYLYRFYLPVMEDLLEELKQSEGLYYTHLRSAKAGLHVLHEDCTAEESDLRNAQIALQRLKDWHGLTADQAKEQVASEPYDYRIVKEHTGTKYEIVQFARRMAETELGEGQYRFVIYRAE